MKTKAIIIAAIAFIAAASTSFAQPGRNPGAKGNREEMAEKIRAEKIAFLTTELSITSEESADFWAIYNAADKKRNEAMRAVNKASFQLRKALKAESADAGKILDEYEKAIKARNEADAEAVATFRKKFGDEKALKLIAAEEKFIQFQLFKLNHGKHNPGDKKPGDRPEGRGPRGHRGGETPAAAE